MKKKAIAALFLLLLIILLFLSSVLPRIPYQSFFYTSAEDLLARMTLEEKIGQVLIFGFPGYDLDGDYQSWLSTGKLGNIKIFLRNVASRDALRALCWKIYMLSESARVPIPPFIATDQEGGEVNHILWPQIMLAPGAALIGATRDKTLDRITGRIIALTLHDLGISMNFAPCADILTNPADRVIGSRSYSADPILTRDMVDLFVREQDDMGILSVVKHFPGHGMTTFDSHHVSQTVDESKDSMYSVHMMPYSSLIKTNSIPGIMVAHVIYKNLDPNDPATFSPVIVHDILRGEFGYSGITVTDDLEMDGAEQFAGGDIVKAFTLAFKADNDILMVAHTKSQQALVLKSAVALFTSGALSVADLDRKVLRIIKSKQRYMYRFFSIPIDPSKTLKEINKLYTTGEDRAVKGITLYSNRVKASSLPDYIKKTLGNGKGVSVISPYYTFTANAKKYLPQAYVIQVPFIPPIADNDALIASLLPQIAGSRYILLGLANERQMAWAKAISARGLRYGVFSVENPFHALPFKDSAEFIIGCYTPFGFSINSLFRAVFVQERLDGAFPFVFPGK